MSTDLSCSPCPPPAPEATCAKNTSTILRRPVYREPSTLPRQQRPSDATRHMPPCDGMRLRLSATPNSVP